jgi:hypothetical protein
MKSEAPHPVWRYLGMWRCTGFNTDTALCDKLAQQAERTDKLAGVLYFQSID